ncbi:MAG: DUF4349 domain-containing protein [Actinobacteria bacterium]|nr:DUF4349 domain-containing protein [Actinomycetota bacterium]
MVPVRFLLIALLLVVTVAACGGGDDAAMTTGGFPSTTMAAPTTVPAGLPAGPGQEGESPAGRDTDSQGVVAVLQPGDFGRSIVYTASLQIEVDDVVAAGRQALVELQGLGGVLFGQETTSGPEPRSVLTIKVRPENFAAALDRLAGLGTLLNQNVYADDVTERVVDLRSRITTAEASVERLRTFLAGATDLKDVAALEGELLQRETDLEVMRGQLRTLEDQVALATIVLILTQPSPDPAFGLLVTAYLGHDEDIRCPGGDELAVDEGDRITVCYELRNTGDTFLGDIEVRDPGLNARFDQLRAVQGDPAAPLPPGGRLILAFQTRADPDRWIGPQVRATALDAAGTPLWQQVEMVDLGEVSLQVAPDTSLPGFGDALGAAWSGLQRFGGALVVVGGALLPWLWVPVLLAAAWWWRRRRRRAAPAPAVPPAPPVEPAEE